MDGNQPRSVDDSISNLVHHLRNNQEQESRLYPQNHITPGQRCTRNGKHLHTRNSDLTADDTPLALENFNTHFIKTHYQSYLTPQYIKESRRKRE